MSRKKYLFFAIALLQIIFLSSMIWFHQAKLNKSTRILLETVPYDPMSIFRGRYVNLRYHINELPASLLKGVSSGQLKDCKELFVTLKKKGDYWEAEGIYTKKPKDMLYLTARLPGLMKVYVFGKKDKIYLQYGIESFFLNEKLADEVESSVSYRGNNWQEMQKLKKEKISQLDEETKRIYAAKIRSWWYDILKPELQIWVNRGVISAETKDKIQNNYQQSLDKIKAVEESVRNRDITKKPLVVEIAIDRQGNGYPVRLFMDGKEYK
ncbi:MAG: GDYXXLXY domain-containing protein [Candidatus Omnitrophota bacterium]